MAWHVVGVMAILLAPATWSRGDVIPPPPVPAAPSAEIQTYPVRGVVRAIRAADLSVVIAHEAIPDYMRAMTMPFAVRDRNLLNGIQPGDAVAFDLRVTAEDSWIEKLRPVRVVPDGEALADDRVPPGPSAGDGDAVPAAPGGVSGAPAHPLRSFAFTNELGRPMALDDFQGRALAITFFFTRCPIPNYCPRLTRNFQEAAAVLAGRPGGPTNWHFLSVTIDPEHDTPAVLRAYGRGYGYDPARWSFLTGPAERIAELARLSGVEYGLEGGLLNHNFRTLILGVDGRLRVSFPMGGDLSERIAEEMTAAVQR